MIRTLLKSWTRIILDGEGWGICSYKNNLIVSDGSNKLQFFDNDFRKIKDDLSVTYNGKKLDGLNELECVEDKIYANSGKKPYLLAP